MELKSKISTSIDQSKKLLELGLKAETADMRYHFDRNNIADLISSPMKRKETSFYYGLIRHERGEIAADKMFERLYGRDIPSWSLSRLIELMPKKIEIAEIIFGLYILPAEHGVTYTWISEERIFNEYKTIDASCGSKKLIQNIIEMINWLIKNNYFNKEYLCKKE